MSLKYNDVRVTLDNYKSIFSNCSPDVLDEIRLAILDDTPIIPFIKLCGNNSYKLGQIRLALREMLPLEYLCTNATGKTIYYIRNTYKKSELCSNLLAYISNTKSCRVLPSTFEILAEFTYIGTDISRVDFTKIKASLVPIFCKGLKKGYPMWLLQDEKALDEERVNVYMKMLRKGLDIQLLLNEAWETEKLYILLSYVDRIDLNNFLTYVTPQFTKDELYELLNAYEKGIDITEVCIRDEDGYAVYNNYQMDVLLRAIEEGKFCKELVDPSLSDKAMEDILNAL